MNLKQGFSSPSPLIQATIIPSSVHGKNMDRKDVFVQKEQWLYEGFLKLKKFELKYRKFAGDISPTVTREVLYRPTAVAVLPYDPYLDKVVLIEQFRVGALESEFPWLLEIVAGLQQESEVYAELAKRELYEETGLRCSELLPVYEYWVSPGSSNEKVILYCAKVDANHAQGVHGLAEEHEDIRVVSVSSEEAFDLLERGKITNSFALIALQWLQLHKKKILEQWNKE
jgi:ADP-ribose pyrophosphatase